MEKKNIVIFSITDHNYIYPDITKLKAKNSQFIQGVEISSLDTEKDLSLHILGYSCDFDISLLNKELEFTREGYNKRARNIIKKLNSEYESLGLDFYKIMTDKKTIVSRNDIAMEFLKRTETNMTFKEATLLAYSEDDENFMLTPKEAVDLIIKCGGVPVLAHPGRILQSQKINLEDLVKELKSAGLKGIEAYYSSHADEEENKLKYICEKYGLAITCGNDWHGPNFTPNKKIGRNINKEELKRFLEILK
ncbi:hypothetical protein HY249_02910 [Candidatus Azambacteria bacterium]|nr:hypothetical protein [Candidatus Azambacteria bacterium]